MSRPGRAAFEAGSSRAVVKPADPLEAMAQRLDRLQARGERIVYARGSLAVLCGEAPGSALEAVEQKAWRRVRAAAQAAEAEGRAALVQRRLGDDAFEYLAVGLGGRPRR